MIYLELLRREYDVYIGKLDELEIDFVAVNQTERSMCRLPRPCGMNIRLRAN